MAAAQQPQVSQCNYFSTWRVDGGHEGEWCSSTSTRFVPLLHTPKSSLNSICTKQHHNAELCSTKWQQCNPLQSITLFLQGSYYGNMQKVFSVNVILCNYAWEAEFPSSGVTTEQTVQVERASSLLMCMMKNVGVDIKFFIEVSMRGKKL